MASSDRPHAHRGAPFDTIWDPDDHLDDQPPPAEGPQVRGGALPPELARYGRWLAIPLRPDRPTIISNFVESLDGVVAFGDNRGSGAEVSGYNEPDRFVMGLLRTLADVVIVGAGTIRASPNHEWTARRVNPAYADAYAAWRSALGIARPQPTTIVVSARGELDPGHRAFASPDTPVVIVTTALGKGRLRGRVPGHVRMVAVSDTGHIPPNLVLATVEAEGATLALCEGGPRLMGSLVGAGLIDELFLTIAPQLLGRDPADPRPGFINGHAFPMNGGRWTRLASVRRSVDHLFLRYRHPHTAAPG
jgi:riboflavin biosynthesis pyrimidine reductase